jgi:hypothetical protein
VIFDAKSLPSSLILGNGEQLDLLNSGPLDDAGLPARAYELGEVAGRFTGARIFSANPKLYHAMVGLLARGVPYREISEICSVSVNTVCAVSLREGEPIETIRERVGRLGMDVAALTMEAIRDLLADPVSRARLGLKDLAIAHGIAVQNAQLLLGGATSRMGTEEKPAASHDDYLRFLDGLVNVTPTGSAAETPTQKGAALPVPGAAIEVPASVQAVTVKPSAESTN